MNNSSSYMLIGEPCQFSYDRKQNSLLRMYLSSVETGILQARTQISLIKKLLRKEGVSVEDGPNDDASNDAPYPTGTNHIIDQPQPRPSCSVSVIVTVALTKIVLVSTLVVNASSIISSLTATPTPPTAPPTIIVTTATPTTAQVGAPTLQVVNTTPALPTSSITSQPTPLSPTIPAISPSATRSPGETLNILSIDHAQSSVNNPQVTLKVTSIELRSDRMRWNFELWNQSSRAVRFYFDYPNEYIADENSVRYNILGDIRGSPPNQPLDIQVEAGVQMKHWIDFPFPANGAKEFTVFLAKYTGSVWAGFAPFNVTIPR